MHNRHPASCYECWQSLGCSIRSVSFPVCVRWSTLVFALKSKHKSRYHNASYRRRTKAKCFTISGRPTWQSISIVNLVVFNLSQPSMIYRRYGGVGRVPAVLSHPRFYETGSLIQHGNHMLPLSNCIFTVGCGNKCVIQFFLSLLYCWKPNRQKILKPYSGCK